MKYRLPEKYRFFVKNLIRGLAWLAAIVVLFILFQEHGSRELFKEYLRPLYSQPLLMYLIYTFSEIFFGIIPPELFMVWATKLGSVFLYIEAVVLLAFISYGAGAIGFVFGKFLSRTVAFRFARRKYMERLQRLLHKYGFFLLIVASLTPIPFSAVCMLVGASGYPGRKFFVYTLLRFVRFAVYSVIIWQSQTI